MKAFSVYLICLVIALVLSADGSALASTYQAMKKGAESYQKENYDESLSLFQQALVESPDDPGILYNLSSAQYQAGKFDEAAKGFEAVASRSNDPKLKQKAYYNLGNTAFRQGNLQASADNYRKALDLDRSDLDAKQNLEFVLKAMEKPEQKKSSKDKKDENRGDKNKDQQSSKSQQGQDKNKQNASNQKQEKNKDQQDSSPQSRKEQGQKNEQGELKEAGSSGEQKQGEQQKGAKDGKPLKPGSIAPEEAARLLNTLSDDQRAFLREQAKQNSPKTRGTEKDW
jgi:Ca-activated chloride channel family protein